MGDRSNVFIQQSRREDGQWDGIGVYSHWRGNELHSVAIAALPFAVNWMGDPSYFTRIVVHNILVTLADPKSETGFGLWTDHPDDGVNNTLVINSMTGEYWKSKDFRKDKG